MSELVEQLRAQSGKARSLALAREKVPPMVLFGGEVCTDSEIGRLRSLADLIDKTLDYYQGAMGVHEAEGRTALTFMQLQTLENVMGIVASHVSAVLSGYTQTAREGR